MYRLLKDEDFNPVFSTFYKKLQQYRDSYISTKDFDNLSRTKIEILLCIATEDFPNNAKWIAKCLSVSKALVSQNIDSLVGEGYLNSEISSKDKRWHILSLGEKSLPLKAKLFALVEDFNKTIGNEISYGEMEHFLKTLNKITINLDNAISEINGK